MIRATLWFMPTSGVSIESLAPFVAELSQSERDRAARFAFDRDQRDYLAAHILQRRLLSSVHGELLPADWQFEPGRFGKPRVANELTSVPEFNLSHTRGLVAAIAADVPVGVDVEWLQRRTNPSLAESFFAAEEIRELLALSGDERKLRFLQIWTLKESYIKGTGAGLRQPLDEFYFDHSSAEPVLQWKGSSPQHEAPWRFQQHRPTNEHILALAICAEREAQLTIEARELTPGCL